VQVPWTLLAAGLVLTACSGPGEGTPRADAAATVTTGATPTTAAEIELSGLPTATSAVTPTSTAQSEPATTTTTTPEVPGEVTIAFTGEVLAHRAINRGARQPDGTYDYTSMLAHIAPLTSAADLTICHLEAPVAPPGEDVMVEPQRISSAASITTALALAGFDRCSTASNHSVDRGAAGVDATVAAFEAAGMRQSGVARSEAERLPALDVVNGVRVAHLAYSYGFDGTPLPAGEPWRANVIDPVRIVDDARAMRAAGADVVIVSLHWGASMVAQPTADQRRVAEAVTASGEIDLIVGHHSHVLQPISQVNGVWVVWGLGNFLTDLPTTDRWPAKSQDGVIVTFTLFRQPDGAIAVSAPVVTPTWCDKEHGWVVRSTAERDDPALSAQVRDQLRRSHERTVALLGDYVTS
jgi:poly-gamma-glutamate synthesis protein (capsule biosynthesis protein)